eukprot:TRINITY_DN6121_c0_g1_i2.p1 TRINITY_DN6121_c0_g1~~TRINITY_DN6121_c0_g1_i2.p1  ORF type:complete len:1040 (+),score=199.42 TRINITY_DN6121_c0_g1_i2:48-3167(+)
MNAEAVEEAVTRTRCRARLRALLAAHAPEMVAEVDATIAQNDVDQLDALVEEVAKHYGEEPPVAAALAQGFFDALEERDPTDAAAAAAALVGGLAGNAEWVDVCREFEAAHGQHLLDAIYAAQLPPGALDNLRAVLLRRGIGDVPRVVADNLIEALAAPGHGASVAAALEGLRCKDDWDAVATLLGEATPLALDETLAQLPPVHLAACNAVLAARRIPAVAAAPPPVSEGSARQQPSARSTARTADAASCTAPSLLNAASRQAEPLAHSTARTADAASCTAPSLSNAPSRQAEPLAHSTARTADAASCSAPSLLNAPSRQAEPLAHSTARTADAASCTAPSLSNAPSRQAEPSAALLAAEPGEPTASGSTWVGVPHPAPASAARASSVPELQRLLVSSRAQGGVSVPAASHSGQAPLAQAPVTSPASTREGPCDAIEDYSDAGHAAPVLATRLHAAMQEFGADEAAVYEVLKCVTGDAHWGAVLDAFRRQHSEFHRGDVLAALRDDLSTKELAKCAAILRARGVDMHAPRVAASVQCYEGSWAGPHSPPSFGGHGLRGDPSTSARVTPPPPSLGRRPASMQATPSPASSASSLGSPVMAAAHAVQSSGRQSTAPHANHSAPRLERSRRTTGQVQLLPHDRPSLTVAWGAVPTSGVQAEGLASSPQPPSHGAGRADVQIQADLPSPVTPGAASPLHRCGSVRAAAATASDMRSSVSGQGALDAAALAKRFYLALNTGSHETAVRSLLREVPSPAAYDELRRAFSAAYPTFFGGSLPHALAHELTPDALSRCCETLGMGGVVDPDLVALGLKAVIQGWDLSVLRSLLHSVRSDEARMAVARACPAGADDAEGLAHAVFRGILRAAGPGNGSPWRNSEAEVPSQPASVKFQQPVGQVQAQGGLGPGGRPQGGSLPPTPVDTPASAPPQLPRREMSVSFADRPSPRISSLHSEMALRGVTHVTDAPVRFDDGAPVPTFRDGGAVSPDRPFLSPPRRGASRQRELPAAAPLKGGGSAGAPGANRPAPLALRTARTRPLQFSMDL